MVEIMYYFNKFLDAIFSSTTQGDSKNWLVWACVAKKPNDVMLRTVDVMHLWM